MPEKRTIERAKKDKREGKAPTTQAGEFVREEMEHVKRGKHGVASRQQAIAIGLSKAREAGVEIPENPSKRTKTAKKTAGKKTTAKKTTAKKTTKKAARTSSKKQGKTTARKKAAPAKKTSAVKRKSR